MASFTPTTPSGALEESPPTNLAYAYGLSDFFRVIFEDKDIHESLLESSTYMSSEIYNRFLQLSANISLETISETIGASLELVTISSANIVSTNTYRVNRPFRSSKKIMNRPFLPTSILEDGVHYFITQESSTSCLIHFSKSLSEFQFSTRGSTSGSDYALWFSEIEIDERCIQKHFGQFVNITPEVTTDRLHNLVYGLQFLYTHGPTISMLEQGVGLCAGIPISRETEEILDIRFYLSTDQCLVITPTNQYILPEGVIPSKGVGEMLVQGELLSDAVSIIDSSIDPEWWINLPIPSFVIPGKPADQIGRVAYPGSPFDLAMRNGVHRNKFLVILDTVLNKLIDPPSLLGEILHRAKPSYTNAIILWVVSENTLDEKGITTSIDEITAFSDDDPLEFEYITNQEPVINDFAINEQRI